MIVDMTCSGYLIGVDFSPDAISELWVANAKNTIKIRRKNDPSIRGRYKGGVYPDNSIIVSGEIESVLTFLEEIGDFSACGIEHVMIDLTVKYQDQCNFEIEPSVFFRLAKLNLTLGITCYECSN